MVDPMTSNGVTAALRHAAEASSLIIQYRNRKRIPRLPAAMYGQRVLSLGRFFNSTIENVLYDWPIRNWDRPLQCRRCVYHSCLEYQRSLLAIASARVYKDDSFPFAIGIAEIFPLRLSLV